MSAGIKIIFALLCFILFVEVGASQEQERTRLPTSKVVIKPTPGTPQRTNGFPETIALSPDGRYAALLNNGFGTIESGMKQSIAVVDLQTNQVADFPEDRLGEDAHQSYFIGLAFSSDGAHLYASMGSLSDPTGEHPGNSGNGIAVYRFEDGKVVPARLRLPAPCTGTFWRAIPGQGNAHEPLPIRTRISRLQGGVRNLDLARSAIRGSAITPVSGRRTLRSLRGARWLRLVVATLNAGLPEYLTSLLRAGVTQQSAQRGQRRFLISQ